MPSPRKTRVLRTERPDLIDWDPICALAVPARRGLALGVVVGAALLLPAGVGYQDAGAQQNEPASVFIAPDGSPPSFGLALPGLAVSKPLRPPHRAGRGAGVTIDRSAAFAAPPQDAPTDAAAVPPDQVAAEAQGQAAAEPPASPAPPEASPPSSLATPPASRDDLPQAAPVSPTVDPFRDFVAEDDLTAPATSSDVTAGSQSAPVPETASQATATPATPVVVTTPVTPDPTPVIEPAAPSSSAQAVTTPPAQAVAAPPAQAAATQPAQRRKPPPPGSARSSSAAHAVQAARAKRLAEAREAAQVQSQAPSQPRSGALAGAQSGPQTSAPTGTPSVMVPATTLREQTVGVLTTPHTLAGSDTTALEVLPPSAAAPGADPDSVALAELPPQLPGQGQRSLGTGASDEEEQAVREMMRQLMKEDTVVALVDGEAVRWSDVWESAEELPDAYKADPEAVFPALLQRLIDLTLLNRVGARQGLSADPEVRAKVAAYEERLIRETVLERHLDRTISEAELRQAYLREIDRQAAEMEVRARHILVESPESAREVIQALDGGADFAELARRRSYGSSAARGGDLGTFKLNRMVPSFAKAVTALPAGSYTREPVETEFGWHVILVESRSMKPVLPFEDMRDRLRAKVSRAAVRDLMKQLRGQASIEILPDPERVAAMTGPQDGTARPLESGTAPAASPALQPVPEPASQPGPKARMGLPVVPLDTPPAEE